MGGLLFRFARALLDAARASAIIDRIGSRCPELSRDDLLLVAPVLADRQRGKDGSPKKAAAKRSTPAKKRARHAGRRGQESASAGSATGRDPALRHPPLRPGGQRLAEPPSGRNQPSRPDLRLT